MSLFVPMWLKKVFSEWTHNYSFKTNVRYVQGKGFDPVKRKGRYSP
jgi:hypothetical protein